MGKGIAKIPTQICHRSEWSSCCVAWGKEKYCISPYSELCEGDTYPVGLPILVWIRVRLLASFMTYCLDRQSAPLSQLITVINVRILEKTQKSETLRPSSHATVPFSLVNVPSSCALFQMAGEMQEPFLASYGSQFYRSVNHQQTAVTAKGQGVIIFLLQLETYTGPGVFNAAKVAGGSRIRTEWIFCCSPIYLGVSFTEFK